MLTKKQYLNAMGIDVWERRSLHPAQQVPLEPAKAETSVDVESQPVRTAVKTENPEPVAEAAATRPSSPAGDEPTFRIALYHYETVGLCLLLDEQTTLPRRLCDDIAKVSGGVIETLRFQELKWPMLDTGGIDQSLNAAREVVTQKMLSMPPRVIVFGAGIEHYFQPLSGLSPMQPTTIGRQSVLLVADLPSFLGSADEKRQLLRAVTNWQGS